MISSCESQIGWWLTGHYARQFLAIYWSSR